MTVERMGAAVACAADAAAVDTVCLSLIDTAVPPKPRDYLTSSYCGICSAEVIEATPAPRALLQTQGWELTPQQAHQLVAAMRAEQKMFDLTGALHAAALVSPTKGLVVVREDVGRHNAVDKVIGLSLIHISEPTRPY